MVQLLPIRAQVLILGTPKNQLLHPDEPKRKEGLSTEDIARMEPAAGEAVKNTAPKKPHYNN